MLEPETDRDRNRARGTRGSVATRSWMNKNTPSKAAAMARVRRVRAEPHGEVSVLTMA